jgi:Glycosyl transferase family 11.
MIITRLQGGLGNQMFQYAAGLALAERRRTVLKLDVSWFREYAEFEAHNRYALSCFNVTEQFATQEEIDRVAGVKLTRAERWSIALAERLHLYRYARRHAGPAHILYETEVSPDHFFDAPDPTYLYGMWQSERFFAPYADQLRLHFSFRYPPQPGVEAMARRIRAEGPSIAVHFRRGDYVRNPTFNQKLGVLPLDYYDRAIAFVRERVPQAVLYIFSDDIDAIEREFKPSGPHVFVRATQPWHSFDKIRLMSLCDHAVISNSTFAWWSAWLNPSPTKIIVAPQQWRRASPNVTRDCIPSSWTIL